MVHFLFYSKEAIPYYIFLKDEAVFSMGGVCDVWQNPVSGERVQTFSVLTVQGNELCLQIHNGGRNPGRMPLIIQREMEWKWMDESMKVDGIRELFEAFGSEMMEGYAVTREFLKKGAGDASVCERAA